MAAMSDPHPESHAVSRRTFLSGAAATSLTLQAAPAPPRISPIVPQGPSIELNRSPDFVWLRTEAHAATSSPMQRSGNEWTATGVALTVTLETELTTLHLHAPGTPVTHLHLRWQNPVPEDVSVLGDAWERSYGDLQWLPLQPGRALPWYFVARTDHATMACGVRTGAAAFAFWQVDTRGVSLWLDLRNGGEGVLLGDRLLPLATLVWHRGNQQQSAFSVTQALCRNMAAGVDVPRSRGPYSLHALYGSNDWYYAYGKNTAQGILRDADLMADTAPAGAPRPFTVIDDGYQDSKRFPDMAALAADIRTRGVAPGIWIRPLRAPKSTRETWLLPSTRFGDRTSRFGDLAYDPTVPEANAAILAVVTEAAHWGYDLLKHDFTTYELLGQWGSEMGASPTLPGWHFHDRSRTNAEIISALYRDIRSSAGQDRIVLGCNTVGHLAVGLFDAQRTGDDVSGRVWERTRRMGVNTLAFRLPQHRTFFATDADCVPITPDVRWENTQQWLDVVARSGTVLLVSPQPEAIGPEQKRALREAFTIAVSQSSSEPTDWLSVRTPEHWRTGSQTKQYAWTGPEGADPFWRL